MSYIKKYIQEHCPDCDLTEGLALLKDKGFLSERDEWLASIWHFYNEARTLFPAGRHNRKLAREHTMEMLGITYKTFSTARARMKA